MVIPILVGVRRHHTLSEGAVAGLDVVGAESDANLFGGGPRLERKGVARRRETDGRTV